MKHGNRFFAVLATVAALIATPRALSMDSSNYNKLVLAIDHGDTELARDIFHNNPALLSPELINHYLVRAISQTNKASYGLDSLPAQNRAKMEKTIKGCLEIAAALIVYGADTYPVEKQYHDTIKIARDMAEKQIIKEAKIYLETAIKNADYNRVRSIITQHHDLMKSEREVKWYRDRAHGVAKSILTALKSLQPLPMSTQDLLGAYCNALKIIEFFEAELLDRQDSLYELKEDISVASEIPFSLSQSLSQPASQLASRRASQLPTPAPLLPHIGAQDIEINLDIEDQHAVDQNSSNSCSCTNCVIL